MKPLRLRLAGFLSYLEPQELDFRPARLWVLSGRNGAGKSALFDAMTWALFGQHRAGSQQLQELIHKESQQAQIEFDFEWPAGQIFRIIRQLKRSPRGTISSSQQLFRFVPQRPNDPWEPIPETTKKADFDRWIADHLRLDEATFSASVLLVQGQAERWLLAKPSERASLLASLVNLAPIQALHEAANRRKLDAKATRDARVLALETGQPTDPNDLEPGPEASSPEGDESTRAALEAALEDNLAQQARVREFQAAQARLAERQAAYQDTQARLARAPTTEAQVRRWEELRAVLPVVKQVVTWQAEAKQAEQQAIRYRTEREQAQARHAEFLHQKQQQARAVQQLQDRLSQEETRWQELSLTLRQLSGAVEKVLQLESLRAERDRLNDGQSRPLAIVQAELRSARTRVEQLTRWQRLLPWIERTQADEAELARVNRRLEQVRSDQESILQTGLRLKREIEALTPQVAQAEDAAKAAEETRSVARNQKQRLQQELDRLVALRGTDQCQLCGQPLTEAHWQSETARRQAGLRTASATLERAEEAASRTRHAADTLQSRLAQLERQRQEAREPFLNYKAELVALQTQRDHLLASLSRLQADWPADIARDSSLEHPQDITLPEQIRQNLLQLPQLKQSLLELESEEAQLIQLQAQQERNLAQQKQLESALREQGADAVHIRQQYLLATTEESSLKPAIQSTKASLAEAQRRLSVIQESVHQAVQEMTDWQGKIQTALARQQQAEEAAQRARDSLPEGWQAAVAQARLPDYSRWSLELQTLEEGQIEAEAAGLFHARQQERQLWQAVQQAERALADLASAATLDPVVLEREAEQLKQALAAQQERAIVRRERQRAQQLRIEQQRQLVRQIQAAEQDYQYWKKLADYLGRDYLQRERVRQTEQALVSRAAEFLRGLSRGQLALELAPPESEAGQEIALNLRVRQGASRSTSPVAFLSGSQRFQVAVSLAVAWGGLRQGVTPDQQTLLIDEGFGSLDAEGRQSLIEEFRRLQSILGCVVLVSHQADIAAAFSEGYEVELVQGRSRISRRRPPAEGFSASDRNPIQ